MSAAVLKLIAAVLMALSHIGNVFSAYLPPDVTTALIAVGRPAFPIFAFLVAEGMRHTRSAPKYILRLSVFAVISQAAFHLAFYPKVPFGSGTLSVMATFALAASAIYAFSQDGGAWYLVGAAAVLLPCLYPTDYGTLGIVTIAAAYFCRDKDRRLALVAVCMGLVYLRSFTPTSLLYFACALTSLVPLYLYNGEKGEFPRYFFYVFYPLHMAVYIIIRYWIGG